MPQKFVDIWTVLTMLRRTALVLSLLIVFILLVSCASGPDEDSPQYVGRVNNNKITLEEYNREVWRLRSEFAHENGFYPNAEQMRKLQDDAWRNLTSRYILMDIYDKYQVGASYMEVIDTLRTNPPIHLLPPQVFINESGIFNSQKYFEALTTDKHFDMSPYRDFYRTTYIPGIKLQNIVLANRKITDKELKNLYDMKYTQAEVEIYTFTENSIKNDYFTISDDDARSFYERNRQRYFVEPTVDLNWVVFDVVASERDRYRTQKMADSLYNEIYNGRSFTTLAGRYSSPPYDKRPSDYWELNTLDPEIRQKLQRARENDLLYPFFFKNAWWVIKVIDKTVNLVNLNIIKLENKPSTETQRENRRRMERFTDLCNRIGFTRTAEELNLQVYHQEDLSSTNSDIAGIGDISDVVSRAITVAEKTVLSPMRIPQSDNFITFQVDKKTTGYFKTMYEVIDQIRSDIYTVKKNDLIIAKANSHRDGIPATGTEMHRLTLDYSQKDNYSYEFLTEVVNTPIGGTTKVYTKPDTAYYAKVIYKTDAQNKPPYNTQKASLEYELKHINPENYFQQWLETQRKKAKIVDERAKVARS